MTRILVAGVGNVLLGDDGFGVEVARRLSTRALPEHVRVAEFGIRGFDLACALLEHDAAVVVDATSRGEAPGTLYVIAPEPGAAPPGVEGHSLDPAKVLALARAMGGGATRVRVVGCEPALLVDPDDEAGMRMELSAPVLAAVEPAITLVLRLVGELEADSEEVTS